MSTRAIAPVVGVSKSQAAEDVRGVQNWTPRVNTETGEVSDDYPSDAVAVADADAFAQRVTLEPELWRAFQLGVEHGRAGGWLAGYDHRNSTAWAAAVDVMDNAARDPSWEHRAAERAGRPEFSLGGRR